MTLQRFTWSTVPEMHSCGMQSISWYYQGLATQDLNIAITDKGIEQQPPIVASSATGTSSTASSTPSSPSSVPTGPAIRRRQDFGNYNGYGGSWLPLGSENIATGIDPSAQSWTWSSVNVTQGWYALIAEIPSAGISMQSDSFFVANGTAVFPCLAAPPPASPSSSSAQSTSSTSSTTIVATTTATSGNDSSGGGSTGALASSRVNTGAIAGGVVGGVAFLAALAAALIFFLCRRRRVRARSALGAGAPAKGRRGKPVHSESSFQALSKGHNSHSSSLASVSGMQHMSPGVSEEGGLAMRDADILPYVPPAPIARRVSTHSTGYAPYESYGMAAVRSNSQPGAARDAEVGQTIHESDEALSEGAHSAGARRKPVPKYDAEAFRGADGGDEAADARMLNRHSFVNMKPMQHVIQPDMPAPPRL